jgi:hypothetical protein
LLVLKSQVIILAPWASSRLFRNGRQDFLHLLETDGFDQVVIEPCFPRTLTVRLLRIACHGDQHDVLENCVLTHPFRYLITVELGQADVQQHDVWSVLAGGFQRSQAVMSRPDIMP